jgi:pyridoxal phosphate enzyme (YggS family)
VNAAPSIGERLAAVRERLAAAARRSGRAPEQVRLIGVVKTVAIERIREAVALGLEDLGENRVQDAVRNAQALDRPARWHLIGHLQRNKAAKAAEIFERVHSVDGIEIASALSRAASARGTGLRVLVQVNVSGESTKHGVAPNEVAKLVEAVATLPGLALDGLMTIGTPAASPEDARPEMVAMRSLRDRVESETGVALPELSMGMSDDFEVAIEEGSTMVRVGTALFGERAVAHEAR